MLPESISSVTDKDQSYLGWKEMVGALKGYHLGERKYTLTKQGHQAEGAK